MSVIAPIQRANHGGHFRAYGLRGVAELIDPFLGVDHYWMSAPTFPAHPHAGISAVSYLFLDSETGMVNRDSIGTHNLIQPVACTGLPPGAAWYTKKTLPKPARQFTDCKYSSRSLPHGGIWRHFL